MRPETVLLAIICVFCPYTTALTNVARSKPYTIDSSGFYDVVFQSHNSSGYYHQEITNEYVHDENYLTNDESLILRPALFWTHADTAFNVTLVIDLQSEYITKEVLIRGRCCNMGIYTPTDAHLFGSNDLGAWTWLGGSSNLESGDQTDTPATTYRLHFVNSHLQAFRYMRVVVTGAANRYMSMRSVSIYA